jgi:Na+-transporting NADH:ubiquinone oxidoreductase subunit C
MASPLSLWRSFLARPNDDTVKTLGVAFLLALGASLLVSTVSVNLKPLQDANLAAEKKARMAQMLDTLPGLRDLMEEAGVDALETRIVSLTDGSFAPDIDTATFDQKTAAEDPETSIALSAEADIAGIKRRSNFAPVFLMQRDGKVMLIVLPVHGLGYQSTIRATLALEADLNTIAALTILEQGDTPGFGARIEEPDWLALWPGKQIADEDGTLRISVVRGEATSEFEVDGISGATRTSNGISNMLQFWLGPDGFGPFLARLKQEEL